MRKISFYDGSFALHQITGVSSAGKISAYYAADGTLSDCEIIDARGNSRSVPYNASAIRAQLSQLGQVWKGERR